MADSLTPDRPHASLTRKLSSWTNELRGKLSLPINDVAPHSTDLVKDLWIQVKVPRTRRNQDHVRWIQALRLLDLFASVDSLACWNHIVDLCGAHERLRTLGCPVEFLMEVPPCFELRFDEQVEHVVPTNDMAVQTRMRLEQRYGEHPITTSDIATLLLRHDDDDHERDQDLSDLTNELLTRTRACDSTTRSPTSIRFRIIFQSSQTCTNCRRTRCDEGVVHVLTQVLACATWIEKKETRELDQFTVESLGFDFRQVCATPTIYEMLRQIGCKIPFDILQYTGGSAWPFDMSFGPYHWRVLAPHDNVRAYLGLRRLDLTSSLGWGGSITALCSAVHSSRSLEELAFDETPNCTSYMYEWLKWMAFALFSKTAQHKITKLHLSCGLGFSYLIRSITNISGRESEFQANESRDEILWPPRTITLLAQTKPHGSPYQQPKPYRSTTVYHGRRPVRCLLASKQTGPLAQILIPGVGFDEVAQKHIISEQPAELREIHTIRKFTLKVRSRNMRYDDWRYNRSSYPFSAEKVVELLRLIGNPLEQLTISCIGDRPLHPIRVDDILVHCPHLKSLKLVNLVISAEQLFVSKHGRALQSLSLLACQLIDKPRRAGCAFYVAPFTFPRLTSLYYDSTWASPSDPVPEVATVHDFILELAMQRRVHRLVVKCRDAKQRARYDTQAVRFDGKLIPMLPLREKIAFLSVVTAGPTTSSTAKFELTMDLVALIFEMASTTMWHRHVWTVLK